MQTTRLFDLHRALTTSVWAALFVVLPTVARAADSPPKLPAGPLYAWYREDGVMIRGADVWQWKNMAEQRAGQAVAESDPGRHLDRIVGRPQALRVATPSGSQTNRSQSNSSRTVVRFNGSSALWQAVGSWGTLQGERTVVVYARLPNSGPNSGPGVLFDGSTRVGSSPASWNGDSWTTKAKVTSSPATPTGWRALTFVFDSDAPPLGGLIVGANVATQQALSCDVAEVLVYPRALDESERAAAARYLIAKWGDARELPAAEQPQPLRRADDPRILWKTVRKQGDDGVHTYRIPGLATTRAGTLIAVFDARNKNGADLPGDIDVAMLRSTDDGATWSPMRRIIDFDAAAPGSQGNGVGDPAILVDQRTGAIFVVALWSKGPRAWRGSGPGLTPDETGQLVLVKSTDDGLTWSAPISITPQVKDPAWRLCFNGPGAGIQLRDGTLVFPAQFKHSRAAPAGKAPDVVSHSCFIASRDSGETWKIAPAAIPNGVPTSESTIAQLDDGSLLLSMRDESRSGRRAWARWEWRDDLLSGKWSETWFDLPDSTCMASLIRHPHGELLFANPAHPQRRMALTIRSSRDGGRTWSDGRLLDPSGAMYSCLTILRDGRIGLLYESVDEKGLVFVRFPLDWLLEEPAGGGRAAAKPGNSEVE